MLGNVSGGTSSLGALAPPFLPEGGGLRHRCVGLGETADSTFHGSVPSFPRELGSILGKEFPMRRLARTGLALVGLAMAAPVNAWADPPAAPESLSPVSSSPAAPFGGSALAPATPGVSEAGFVVPPSVPPVVAPETGPGSPLTLTPPGPADSVPTAPAYMPPNGLANMPPAMADSHAHKAPKGAKARASAKKSPKHRWSLLRGHCQCPDCQRARVMARDGVNVPPPPAMPMVMSGPIVDGKCAACEAHGGQVIMEGPVTIVDANGAPGRAVVGGPVSGYAVVGEAGPTSEPMPIGVVGARLAGTAQPMPTAAAPRDSALMPSSMSPNPVTGHGHNRPHIISHVFFLDGIGKRSRTARARAQEERHAAIPYGPQAEQKVTELPASMVYGRGAH